MDDGKANAEPTKAYVAALEASIATVDELAAVPQFAEHAAELKAKGAKFCDCAACTLAPRSSSKKEYLAKKSMWIFGGDGWAYDIGLRRSGPRHRLQSKDVNIFVFDTEVYSNTGGQASKASNIGQVAQFAAAGKEIKKKSLAEIAMQYGYVYVAQVAMGANPAQTIKAITRGRGLSRPVPHHRLQPLRDALHQGRHDELPEGNEEGRRVRLLEPVPLQPRRPSKKFTLDSKAPAGGYQEFLMNEARYSRLTREFPERADDPVRPQRGSRQGALRAPASSSLICTTRSKQGPIQEGCRRAALLFARRKAETAYIFGDLYKKFIFTSPIEMFYN